MKAIACVAVFLLCLTMSRQSLIAREDQPAEVDVLVIKTAIGVDSPTVYDDGLCPDGMQLDITGTCREVWYNEEYDGDFKR